MTATRWTRIHPERGGRPQAREPAGVRPWWAQVLDGLVHSSAPSAGNLLPPSQATRNRFRASSIEFLLSGAYRRLRAPGGDRRSQGDECSGWQQVGCVFRADEQGHQGACRNAEECRRCGGCWNQPLHNACGASMMPEDEHCIDPASNQQPVQRPEGQAVHECDDRIACRPREFESGDAYCGHQDAGRCSAHQEWRQEFRGMRQVKAVQ